MVKYLFIGGFSFCLLLLSSGQGIAQQEQSNSRIKKATGKIEKGFYGNNLDTLAQGYFDLGESYYQKNDLLKSESYYKESKQLFEKTKNAEGVAKSSRALAKVQEDLNKKKEALVNYTIAKENSLKTGDANSGMLNRNDIKRLSEPEEPALQQQALQDNINLSIRTNDSAELVSSYSRMAGISAGPQNINTDALTAYKNAYRFSKTVPEQAVKINQLITNEYLKQNDFSSAIESKKQIFGEKFLANSTLLQASEMNSLADIYLLKNDEDAAVKLLYEAYSLSVENGHTLEAKTCIEKLDSIFLSNGRKEKSLGLYKSFLTALPAIMSRDSSLTDYRIIADTENKLRKLETEKALKDELIRKKNVVNFWLITLLVLLVLMMAVILYTFKKLQVKNKKIALQSLRREMNPHFIFNSLNSINQFIANNNELEANQYLTRFSTLMRRVMENSKDDFILFSKETELLQSYLELEHSRFPDKFDFRISIDEALAANEQYYIPGMLIQPHLENAIWHGLRYSTSKGLLSLSFIKRENILDVIIEDNGIGIAESKKTKTVHQQQHSGRGIKNTYERIKILNQLYHHNITCVMDDKLRNETGVKVSLSIPLIKNYKA